MTTTGELRLTIVYNADEDVGLDVEPADKGPEIHLSGHKEPRSIIIGQGDIIKGRNLWEREGSEDSPILGIPVH